MILRAWNEHKEIAVTLEFILDARSLSPMDETHSLCDETPLSQDRHQLSSARDSLLVGRYPFLPRQILALGKRPALFGKTTHRGRRSIHPRESLLDYGRAPLPMEKYHWSYNGTTQRIGQN